MKQSGGKIRSSSEWVPGTLNTYRKKTVHSAKIFCVNSESCFRPDPKRQSTAALQNLSDSRSAHEMPQGFGVRLCSLVITHNFSGMVQGLPGSAGALNPVGGCYEMRSKLLYL